MKNHIERNWFNINLCLNFLHMLWIHPCCYHMCMHMWRLKLSTHRLSVFLSTLCLLTIIAGFRHGQKVSCLQKSTSCTGTWTQWRGDKQEKESKAHGQVWVVLASDNCLIFLYFLRVQLMWTSGDMGLFGLTVFPFSPWFCARLIKLADCIL